VRSYGSFTLSDNVENLELLNNLNGIAFNSSGAGNALNNRITGNSGRNNLQGGDGHDVLDGGAGVDTLVGGNGDDVYYVDTPSDVVIEDAFGGDDVLVITKTGSYTTPANVESVEATRVGSGLRRRERQQPRGVRATTRWSAQAATTR